MKKHSFLLFFIIFSPFAFLYPQQMKNIVTSIEVSDVVSNTVVLRWKSDINNGNFSLYYHNKVIKDQFALQDAEFIIRSNFSGEALSGFYQYEYQITLNQEGTYFFAVILNETSAFDDLSRQTVSETIVSPQEILITPGLNTTIQPIYITFFQNKFFKRAVPKISSFQSKPILTSLALESFEDVFQLKWSVYPKDLSQYIFIIYRSRYPIIQYKNATGLPEYARVTNQFSFEDRNIAFEDPYYYAVITEGSTQWAANINVFTQPAVLLRKSPPLSMIPAVEYIKRRKTFPNITRGTLSEEDIQIAVEQTLSNLQLVSSPSNVEFLQNILKSTVLPIDEMSLVDPSILSLQQNNNSNLSLVNQLAILQRSDSEIKTRQTFPKLGGSEFSYDRADFLPIVRKFTNIIIQQNKSNSLEIVKLEKYFLDREYSDFNSILSNILHLSQKIKEYESLEKKLVTTDHLPINDLKKNLSNYYTARDQIRIEQYKINGIIKGFHRRREEREKSFFQQITSLQQKEQQQYQQTTRQYQQAIKQHQQAIKQHRLIMVKQSIDKNQKFLDQYKKKKDTLERALTINSFAKDIALQTKTVNIETGDIATKTPINIKNNSSLQELDSTIKELSLMLEKEKNSLLLLSQEEQLANNSNSEYQKYIDNFVQMADYPKRMAPEAKLENLKSYYNDVSVEKIPDIHELTQETWISQKEIWMYTNKETWLSKQELWRRRTREILGEDYQRISSKWMTPSYNLALVEGKKAFELGNHAEAIYLLNFVSQDPNALMALGKSYFNLEAYRDAFTIFITAVQMGIPESRYWLDSTAEKILNRKIKENTN